MSNNLAVDYRYESPDGDHTQTYVWKPVLRFLSEQSHRRVFDLGCGNGVFARRIKGLGFEVCGVDPSEQGIEQARKADPDIPLELGNAYEPLSERFGQFPLLVSLEVVCHLYHPRKYARCVADLLEPGGMAIISTPYHGYWKNLALAIAGRMDAHLDPLWDNGMIKFWTVNSLKVLFSEVGLECRRVERVGRVPVLAKSMVMFLQRR